jgi:hypothetical protein
MVRKTFQLKTHDYNATVRNSCGIYLGQSKRESLTGSLTVRGKTSDKTLEGIDDFGVAELIEFLLGDVLGRGIDVAFVSVLEDSKGLNEGQCRGVALCDIQRGKDAEEGQVWLAHVCKNYLLL